jgi:hypothetical protein
VETRTAGSASGLGKRTSSNAGTAPQADSTVSMPRTMRHRTWGGASARALDAREPVSDERAQEVRLLVGQCVARVIDHRERGVRVVV